MDAWLSPIRKAGLGDRILGKAAITLAFLDRRAYSAGQYPCRSRDRIGYLKGLQ